MEFARKAKPHVVCIPFPAQSHIKAMLKLAKLLHNKGLHITFINTEFNHKRFVIAGGPNSLDGLPDFRFETIPDGLPPSDADATQDMIALSESVRRTCYAPFLYLCNKLDNPPVSSIVSDGFMTFTFDAAEVLGIPVILFWTLSACGFMGFCQCQALLERGLIPLKDESYLTNGYLDTVVDYIPGMKDIRLKDFPGVIRTTNQDDFLLNFGLEATQRSYKASANVIQTFDALEPDLVNALSTMLPDLYTIGPVQLLLNQTSLPSEEEHLKSIGYSLWKEEHVCLEWLNSKGPNSVVYVNFGSITVVTPQQLVEFALGLANSNQPFLWIIRPDLVVGESPILPPEFVEVTKERGFIASWCPQEQVLNHPSVGGFLTHCGWNSTIESLSSGVPMICWPFLADQPTNCRFICKEWEVGIEIDDVNAEKIEKLERELIEGVEGKRMKNKAIEWKKRAEEATAPDGSSITVMTPQQLVEFALGLANSNQLFLWIIRPDLVVGESAILPPEFVEVTKERGFIASWCPQEQVLDHPSIGGFLTHCGWNSTIESLSSGVPMICWPFFGDQPTNCRFSCKEWEVGIEIGDVNTQKIDKLVRELIEGVEGKRMRNKAIEWKKRAEEATAPDGSSSLNLERLTKNLWSYKYRHTCPNLFCTKFFL
ncbi:hypothetical protein RJ640_012891 [Escallonia rubra]|uniref:Glycosyltransferase n=1 Tax=Escallonia rubra TaxID=112253 RepID=A0AA88RHZ3_9ASTE|nr:hypothetical protein RJ640_012891 [Escallonia rubra]